MRKFSRKWRWKIQNVYVSLNFFGSGFPRLQDKIAGISKKNSANLYPGVSDIFTIRLLTTVTWEYCAII